MELVDPPLKYEESNVLLLLGKGFPLKAADSQAASHLRSPALSRRTGAVGFVRGSRRERLRSLFRTALNHVLKPLLVGICVGASNHLRASERWCEWIPLRAVSL